MISYDYAMQSPTSSQLPEQDPSLAISPISPFPRTPSPEDIATRQVTFEGNVGPIPPTSNDESELAESLQPSAPESAPHPGEAIPLVEKHAKTKA